MSSGVAGDGAIAAQAVAHTSTINGGRIVENYAVVQVTGACATIIVGPVPCHQAIVHIGLRNPSAIRSIRVPKSNVVGKGAVVQSPAICSAAFVEGKIAHEGAAIEQSGVVRATV